MDYITYQTKFKEIEKVCNDSKIELAKQYATENNPYQIDDVITDHIGSIKISIMKTHVGFSEPEMMYFGKELKKDGTPKKSGESRYVYQSNIIK
jgi:hypothetical protein